MATTNSADTQPRIARPVKGGSGKAGRPFGRGGRKATGRKTGAGKAVRRKPARRAKKKR